MAEITKVDLEQLLNCALCPNLCRCDCPVLQVSGREAVAPAGKARLAGLAYQGFMPWDEEMLEAVANCLGCRNCTILCPFPDLNLCDELLNARIGEQGAKIKLPFWEPFLNNLKKYSSPYGRKERVASLKENEKTNVEVIYYAGCTTLANNRAALEAAEALLSRAGVNYTLIDEDCCGYPAETWGDLSLAKQLASENSRKIAASGASKLITGCPECWQTFSERYPAWGYELPLEIIDGPTYFLELLSEGRLEPLAEQPLEVSYHDPCIWARTAEKVSEPRNILNRIPGLKIFEPEHTGKETRCCGGGRMFQLSFPETAAKVASRRLTDFSEGKTIVTACPFCREGLLGPDHEVLELVELLARVCLKQQEE